MIKLSLVVATGVSSAIDCICKRRILYTNGIAECSLIQSRADEISRSMYISCAMYSFIWINVEIAYLIVKY